MPVHIVDTVNHKKEAAATNTMMNRSICILHISQTMERLEVLQVKKILEIINKSQCYYSWSNKKLKPLLETILANSTTIYSVADSGATKYFFQNKNIEKNSCNPINGIFMDNSIINPRTINE